VYSLFFEDALALRARSSQLQQLSLDDGCANSVSDDRDDDAYCSNEEMEVRNRNGEQNSANTQKEWAAATRDLREYPGRSIPLQWAWKMKTPTMSTIARRNWKSSTTSPYGPVVLHDGAVADSIDDRAYPQS